jgi:hypothetical protein
MKPPLLLYSASTWLAYSIAERFYGGIHYAWCSPFFDGSTAALHVNVPPSSSPAEIYWSLWQETRRGERHSEAMRTNRRGILAGARAKAAAGVVTPAQVLEIRKIVNAAHPREFRPLLFVIPFAGVEDLVSEVPVSKRAHPLSIELRVAALPRDRFDVLELRR